MQYILVDIADREHFYPFSLTRSLAECRVGIYTFKERWEAYLGEECGVYTANHLQGLYEDSHFLQTDDSIFFINITCIPTKEVIAQIKLLQDDEKLINTSGKWIASKSKERALTPLGARTACTAPPPRPRPRSRPWRPGSPSAGLPGTSGRPRAGGRGPAPTGPREHWEFRWGIKMG